MSTLTDSDDAQRECCRDVAGTSAVTIARLTRELAEARADSDEAHALTDRLSDLLTRTVNTLRGDPPPLVMWSWHDIPDLVAGVVAERDEARAQAVAVRALHKPENDYVMSAGKYVWRCRECRGYLGVGDTPQVTCPTIRALGAPRG